MDSPKNGRRTEAALFEENEQLRQRLEETEQALEAIRQGEVDAIVVGGPRGEQVYSLTGAEHAYRVIVETMNEAALTVALDGTILFCNHRFCDLMRTPMHQVVGRNIETCAAEPQRQALNRTVAEAETGPIQRHLALRAADGTVVPVLLSASLLAATDSTSICLVASDLTELEQSAQSIRVLREHKQSLEAANQELEIRQEELSTQAEELRVANEEIRANERALRELNTLLESKVAQRTAELQRRARQLQELALELSQAEERERKRLAEILHDDLQQHLAGTKFHVGLIAKRFGEGSQVRHSLEEVEGMIKEAIEKSRGLSHELSPPVLHHGTLGDAMVWLGRQVRKKHGLTVRTSVPEAVDSHSEGLKTFLYQACREMLFNVIKHARTNEARIRVRRLGPCLCLAVSDRGRGFDPQALQATKGFGLLSIRERVELMGGRMRIRSGSGRGSTFFITVADARLPQSNVPPEIVSTQPLPSPSQSRPRGDGRRPTRVLLVDDHEIVREGLAALFDEQPDMEVVGEAGDGRRAVTQAYRLEPDVIIMDVALPILNGFEATEQIKRALPATRIIALSMHQKDLAAERMRLAGAEQYLLKTASSDEILAAIRDHSQAPAQPADPT